MGLLTKNRIQRMKKFLLGIAALLIFSLHGQAQALSDKPDYDPVYPGIYPVCDCGDLVKLSIPNTIIESAVVIPKDSSCRVTAIVNHPPFEDKVKVVIALPCNDWNGRFYGTGGGGFAGGELSSVNKPVSEGFASGYTNAGHEGNGFNASFALDTEQHRLRWQEIRDFAYLGIHDMTVVGKELVRAYYGKPAGYSYFIGGSGGGRQALAEAQRYPGDYDGIIALCPAVYWNDFLIGHLWPQAVMHDANNYVTKEKLQAVTNAVISACDGDDGQVDGVIDDPVNCTWDPEKFVGTSVNESVFTTADADVVRKIWEGPRSYDGKFLWYGQTKGSDISIHASSGEPFMPFVILGEEWVRSFLVLDRNWNSKSLTKAEFISLFYQSVDQYASTLETANTDLSDFRDQGGKLMILQGLADQLIPAQGIIQYYEELQKFMGGTKKTSKFARMFLIPGVDHSITGPAAGPVDQFEALVKWVEEGKAPDRLNAVLKDKNGTVISSRQLFPYE